MPCGRNLIKPNNQLAEWGVVMEKPVELTPALWQLWQIPTQLDHQRSMTLTNLPGSAEFFELFWRCRLFLTQLKNNCNQTEFENDLKQLFREIAAAPYAESLMLRYFYPLLLRKIGRYKVLLDALLRTIYTAARPEQHLVYLFFILSKNVSVVEYFGELLEQQKSLLTEEQRFNLAGWSLGLFNFEQTYEYLDLLQLLELPPTQQAELFATFLWRQQLLTKENQTLLTDRYPAYAPYEVQKLWQAWQSFHEKKPLFKKDFFADLIEKTSTVRGGQSFFAIMDYEQIYSVSQLIDLILFNNDNGVINKAGEALLKIINHRSLTEKEIPQFTLLLSAHPRNQILKHCQAPGKHLNTYQTLLKHDFSLTDGCLLEAQRKLGELANYPFAPTIQTNSKNVTSPIIDSNNFWTLPYFSVYQTSNNWSEWLQKQLSTINDSGDVEFL